MQMREHSFSPPHRQPSASGAAASLSRTLVRGMRTEFRLWSEALCARVFAMLLVAFGFALLLVVQIPLHYTIDVGKEEGYGSDLPQLRGFNTAERDVHGSYRWTDDGAMIVLPGLGQRPVVVQLDFFPINAQVVSVGPKTIEVWSGETHVATLPVRADGGHYRLAIPAHLLIDGDLSLTLRTATFSPPGDPRQLGTPLDRVTVISAAAPHGIVVPTWTAIGTWMLAALLGWATLLRALGTTVTARRWACGLLIGAMACITCAALFDPPRWAFGALPALIALACCYLLASISQGLLPRLAARFAVPLDVRTRGWLVLIVVAGFGLRFGGRLYPRSMHGDIGYHTNRFNDTVLGLVYLLSRNRGIDFPYPSGPYLTLAPLTLLGIETPLLIQLTAALAEGLGGALVFAMVAWTGQAVHTRQMHRHRAGVPAAADYLPTALLAAAIYVFSAAGFMTTWWSFSTHIYAQFATLLLLTALVYVGLKLDAGRWTLATIGVLMLGVFLGHFGFFINTVLLLALLTGLLWLAAWRGADWAGQAKLPLTVTFVGAGLFAGVFFYSAYLPMLLSQAQTVATGGLTELAQRAPADRAYLWSILWNAGLITHFGFFPLLLAPFGLILLARWGPSARVLLVLMIGSFGISACFAVLPFITLSTQSTRWLMFSAWAIAIGAAISVRWLWHHGRVGKVAVVAMAGFMLWNTAVVWLGGMLWRIRPPEPF